jgi:hypothetical protein
MGLIDTFCAGPDRTDRHVHQFMAALGELERGKMTRAQVISAFGITQAEETELDALIAKVRTVQDSYPLSGQVTLTNVGTTYDTNTATQAMPFVWVQCAGITRIDLEVRSRKTAAQTGNIDYQLWDETNGISALDSTNATTGSLTHTGAAGDVSLVASRTFAAPLSPGVRKLRMRAKDTVAADDPVFLNAALLVTRVDTITADVLHQLLCLGEDGIYSAATIRSRLGI